MLYPFLLYAKYMYALQNMINMTTAKILTYTYLNLDYLSSTAVHAHTCHDQYKSQFCATAGAKGKKTPALLAVDFTMEIIIT